MSRVAVAVATATLLAGQAAVDPEKPASEFPATVSIERKDKKITAVRYGPEDAGFAIICTPADDDPEKITRSVFVDVLPYRVHVTIEKNVIKGPIAVVSKREGGDGRLEVYQGTAKEPPEGGEACLPEVTPDPQPGTVLVEQGKTRLTGSRLVYDESDGLAVVSGPIVFERPQKGDQLTGKSERITIDVDNERTVLEGNVTLDSKCRSSTAERVEYDDRKNLAVLFGKPAVSRGKTDGAEVKGDRLEYNLETNDVVVSAANGGVNASFQDDAQSCT